MRSTAEAKGRNPEIAEAMVDEEIRLDSLIQDGKVLTFSVSEAIEYGFCEAEVEGISDIMLRSGVSQYDINLFELNWSERFIALFLNPAVSGVLILLILGGLYFELQSPGIGFPIVASFIATLLYFTPYYLNGLAENWEIILFFIGILFIALEVFVIPGFGLPGILGLIFTIGSLTLVMINNDGLNFDLIEASVINNALITSLIGFLGALFMMILLGARLTKTSFFNRFALTDVQDTSTGYTSSFYNKSLIGSIGTVVSIMRPSGRIMIDDTVYDAYTRGEYLEKGEKIKVIASEGTSLKVQKSAP
jgi:membrane-bound serine protease (ClpP class)